LADADAAAGASPLRDGESSRPQRAAHQRGDGDGASAFHEAAINVLRT